MFVVVFAAVGVLVGASFMLPSVASAVPCADPSGSVSGPFISESSTFGAGEIYTCNVENFTGTIDLAFVLYDDSSLSVVSDNFNAIAFGVNHTLVVTLSSNTEGVQLAPTSCGVDPNCVFSQVQEVPCSNGSLETCDFVDIGIGGGLDMHILSDTPCSQGGTEGCAAPVPEPSTGLFLAATLPAFLGFRRFSMQPSTAKRRGLV